MMRLRTAWSPSLLIAASILACTISSSNDLLKETDMPSEDGEMSFDTPTKVGGTARPNTIIATQQNDKVARMPVAVVNGQEISTATFQARVSLAQWNLTNQYFNLQQILQTLGDDPATLAAYQSQLADISQQLANPLFVGSSILDLLIEEELLAQEAARRGIEVSEEEVDKSIEEGLGFFGEEESATVEPKVDGTPSPKSTPYTRELYERNFEAYLTNVGTFGVDVASLRAEARAILLRDLLEADFED